MKDAELADLFGEILARERVRQSAETAALQDLIIDLEKRIAAAEQRIAALTVAVEAFPELLEKHLTKSAELMAQHEARLVGEVKNLVVGSSPAVH